MTTTKFNITFWGVRGSHPMPSPETQNFGGNTPCVQVEIGKEIIIFDAGTGIIQLGNSFLKNKENLKADIFISHTHWDHIQGLPFFSPIYIAGNSLTIHGEPKNQKPFSDIVKDTIKAPYFPTEWDDMQAEITFIDIEGNEKLHIDNNISIDTLSLCHPGDSLGYRVNFHDKSCCYISDIEYKKSVNMLKAFIKNTDVLIFDAQFTNQEYLGTNPGSSKVGWGHSTWEDAVNLAKETGVKKLVLFHHDVNRSDDELKAIEKSAQEIHRDTIAAYEGLVISL